MRTVYCFVVYLILSPSLVFSQGAPDVGVIRWDAWTGPGNAVGNEVNASLSPNQFHNKLPFYANVLGENSVNIDGTTQATMDQEIDFATRAGLDYWAFIWYPSSSGLHQSRELYLNSSRKSDIDFSLVVESVRFSSGQITHQQLVNSFLDPSYQTVLNGRPLLYFFDNRDITPADFSSIRIRSIAQGTGDPYITIMHIPEGDFATEFNTYGFDAASRYATTWVGDGEPHSSLVAQDAGQWNWFDDSLGLEVIPHVTTGWDNRPRILNPSPFWAPASNSWVEPATPSEITDHVADAVQWVADNPGAAASNNILLYAWNEFDEGGSLAPNLPQFGGTERIAALRNVLVGTGNTIQGDFFLDGTVDGLDLAQWAGDHGLNASSDADGDGDTDGSDFLTWQRQFGTVESVASSSSSQAVPEPSAVLLVTLAGLLLGMNRPCVLAHSLA